MLTPNDYMQIDEYLIDIAGDVFSDGAELAADVSVGVADADDVQPTLDLLHYTVKQAELLRLMLISCGYIDESKTTKGPF